MCKRFNLIGRKHKHIQVNITRKRQTEVSGAIPQAITSILLVTIVNGKFFFYQKGIEIGKACFIHIFKLNLQSAGLGTSIEKREINRYRFLFTGFVGIKARYAA